MHAARERSCAVVGDRIGWRGQEKEVPHPVPGELLELAAPQLAEALVEALRVLVAHGVGRMTAASPSVAKFPTVA